MTASHAAVEATRGRRLEDVTVGLVGAGRMGSALATALAAKGGRLVLYNRTLDRARQLADRLGTGARVAASPAELAAGVDILLTMVTDDAAVRSVYRDRGGALEGLSRRTVAVDMSTVLPDTIRGLEADIRATGAGVLDAPVSGSVTLAEAGTLTLMVGGEAGDLERARPALEAVSRRIFHLGPLGAGATIKLAVNTVVFGLGAALAEALVLAESAGVDRATAYEVFANSTFASPFVDYKRGTYVDPDTTATQFSIDLARKDFGLILELAERVGVDLSQARSNDEQLARAAADLGGDRDFALVAEHLRSRRAGMA
jgi:3-hydroxyisobutyrate dehydrogenase-like beta-hydroxyacid dehydrogenase